MKILVVGAGGREHVLAWSFSRSGHTVIAAPGNPGIASLGDIYLVDPADIDGIVDLAQTAAVDLVVVGPEAPLVAGLADACAQNRIRVFGPTASGAKIEGSKAYAKEIMNRGSVPTARSIAAADVESGLAAVGEIGGRCVVKADGLAAGKGVVVADDSAEAEDAVRACFAGVFGGAGSAVLVEERLDGSEVSLLVLSDGSKLIPLPAAQDHKPIGVGDTGPNTGGMGAYSPVPGVDATVVSDIMDRIIEPTVWSLRKAEVTYRGVLYCGLMMTDDGPKVLEYNCRFGDPEAQAVISRLDCDLGELLAAAADGAFRDDVISTSSEASLCVVAAADGYPAKVRSGDEIRGVDAANSVDGAHVFQAGTRLDDAKLVTSGGRVLATTGLGENLGAARDAAYAALNEISWDGMYARPDIGFRALPSS